MQIGCSRCDARYEIPDAKLKRGAIKVQCSRCGHLFLVKKRAAAAPEKAPEATPEKAREASFEDFDFTRFQEPGGEKPETNRAGSVEEPAPSPDFGGDLDSGMPSLDELDLGEFEGLGDEFNLSNPDAPLESPPEPQDIKVKSPAREPVEHVRPEELVSLRDREPPPQSIPEDTPRLNIQRGPRRGEGAAASPVVARQRRRSPLVWVVAVAALCTAGFTAYNFYHFSDEAFTFLNPSQIRKLWRHQAVEAEFGKEDLKGYYKEMSAGRRVFVIQGLVVNRSSAAQSLIRVEGHLYGREGRQVATRSAYCGNVLSDRDLASLPVETIEARLQNQMGEAFKNVDIAPGARVPFMLVFPSPPPDVEKFSVTVTEARIGSKS